MNIPEIEKCWDCKKEVNVKKDDYYLFEPTLEVLCKECCDKEGINLNGERIEGSGSNASPK